MLKIALAGNPNTGKTSLFNILTGLRHKVGNYPGITVEKKEGIAQLSANQQAIILDLPGTYSIHPTSVDEQIVFEVLVNDQNQDHPDLVVYVAEAENLKRNLFLFSQLRDLGLPLILVINMIDKAKRKGIEIDFAQLSALLHVPVVPISSRKKIGIEDLKSAIINHPLTAAEPMVVLSQSFRNLPCEKIRGLFPQYSYYKSWLLTTYAKPGFLPKEKLAETEAIRSEITDLEKYHQREAILRYQKINEILQKTYIVDRLKGNDLRAVLDRIFIHKVFGYVIFAAVLLLIFQSVFAWTSAPMDWIDSQFAMLAELLKTKLPPGRFTDLITDGIIPGIGGIVIFVPQIAVLIFFISILEETGYMSRVVFLMDKIMRRYGMSGKSVLPLVSGTACAIPAVMSTRNIENWRERLITIFVIPFTTCSARLPVYTILISLIIPKKSYFGLINLQGLVLMALYMVGFASAFAAANVLNRLLKREYHNFFVAELPEYQLPLPINIFYSVWDKTKSFVLEAGKIILSISVILWFLASTGYDDFESQNQKTEASMAEWVQNDQQPDAGEGEAVAKLENSYLGRIGKAIEPVIAPLGYDWKIGIAILSSFAAREVFVGTLATIYSVEDADEQSETVRNRMRMEMRPDGTPVFNFATGISLLLFYAFAMQCMSTLAIVKRETNSWKWPLIQLVSMGALAYIVSLLAYQILK